ncbi:unnamed protein product [Bemisia tabaci]|uniref:Uncharacterized protein n=1 Tax=Bemisia tabaci TaxID=7038 RepID=A0A9P0A131_BEMTA|nr:PREDICTED: uncharacterized protein LOC109034592 [Bemisia tabaci]CAH0382022.1 unnamed protein product [Bemisia tabaci]
MDENSTPVEETETFIYTINNTEESLISSIDPYYDDHYIADVWVGVILTLLVLSCIGCVCSCLLYYKFQEWKRSLLAQNPEAGEGNEGYVYEVESLPSYTVVTGLPSYEEAMKQLQEIRTIRRASLTKQTSQEETDGSTPTQNAESATKSPRRLSLAEMFLRRLSKS